jgi:hypothetical protein
MHDWLALMVHPFALKAPAQPPTRGTRGSRLGPISARATPPPPTAAPLLGRSQRTEGQPIEVAATPRVGTMGAARARLKRSRAARMRRASFSQHRLGPYKASKLGSRPPGHLARAQPCQAPEGGPNAGLRWSPIITFWRRGTGEPCSLSLALLQVAPEAHQEPRSLSAGHDAMSECA